MAALGIGLLAGVVTVRLMDALNALSDFNDLDIDRGESSSFQIGLGIWLPVGAAAVALLGLVFALTRPKTAWVRTEPDTPRMGVPMPYGYQQYQQQQPQQYYPQAPQQQHPPQQQQAPTGPPTPPQQAAPTPPQSATPAPQPPTAEPQQQPPPEPPREQAPAEEPKPGDQPEN
jgi:outer membrane biosynthesis protein TonB